MSNIHPIMHVSLLKPYTALKGVRPPPLPNGDGTDEYEIENILAHRRTKGGQKKYLVKWKGYTFEESTWEPEKNFKQHTIAEYHRKRKEEKEEESDSDDDNHTAATMISRGRDGACEKHGNARTNMEVEEPLQA